MATENIDFLEETTTPTKKRGRPSKAKAATSAKVATANTAAPAKRIRVRTKKAAAVTTDAAQFVTVRMPVKTAIKLGVTLGATWTME